VDSRSQQHSHHLRRPSDGWTAWQMTLGYIGQHYGPDVFLMVQVQPKDADHFLWAATASWGQQYESVTAAESIAAALDQLWQTVARFFVRPMTLFALLLVMVIGNGWMPARTLRCSVSYR
jgi:hypothetical protein